MALYHKYRPQNFSDVTGQQYIIKTVTNQITNNKATHAYLFCGPRGVGKTTIARLIAKSLNCEKRKDKNFEPCNDCASCSEITSGRAIDVIEVDAASHTGVDNVRENIIDNAQFKPSKSKFKVFIIDEVHMLSTNAFNALLKTLEEPPSHVIFILATTELHKIPETIVSRCQKYQFQKVGYEILKNHLQNISKQEGVKIDDRVIDRIINKSDGCVRDAMSLLDQLMATGEKHITDESTSVVLPTSHVEDTLAFVSALISKDGKKSFEVLSDTLDNGVRVLQFVYDSLELLRAIMVIQATGVFSGIGIDLTDTAQEKLKELSQKVSSKELINLIDILMKRLAEIKKSHIAHLPIEMGIVEFCFVGNEEKMVSNAQLSSAVEKNSDVAIINKQLTNSIIKNDENPLIELGVKSVNTSDDKKKSPDENVKIGNKKIAQDFDPIKIGGYKGENVCSVEDVQSKWHDCVSHVEHQSPSLVFILKMAKIAGVDGNTVNLSVQYDFHRDKLMDHTCKLCIEEALSKFLKSPVGINVVVNKDEENEKQKELQEMADAFGGEVVV